MRINPEFFVSRQRHDAAAIPARVWRAIADQNLVGVDLRSMLPRRRLRKRSAPRTGMSLLSSHALAAGRCLMALAPPDPGAVARRPAGVS